ncbi:uncharacterized protein MT2145-like [Dromiciops gliroides]|uniref:uncharacterized protein MT2145-like n=1 Tax=Dromiciops gliroides TaxID=33562 RepID=UPI001CC4FA84|nr:uncharacterized protein MT2145-like [Dromiciops gliroides]
MGGEWEGREVRPGARSPDSALLGGPGLRHKVTAAGAARRVGTGSARLRSRLLPSPHPGKGGGAGSGESGGGPNGGACAVGPPDLSSAPHATPPFGLPRPSDPGVGDPSLKQRIKEKEKKEDGGKQL